MKLEGRVAIVTGGAGGIGEVTCNRLAAEGAHIVVADILIEPAKAIAEKINSSEGKAIAVKVDATSSQDTDRMVQTVLTKLGKIDILVNNAGGSARERAALFHESKEEVWDWIIALNLKGTRNCTRAVINHMIERKSGKIISMSSVTALLGGKTQVDYSAAKAGIIGFTKALAKEVAPYQINVNCISPGPIDTAGFRRNPDELRQRVRQGILLGRFGQPEEIANLIVFLASDEADFITGQNYIIDGGRTLGT